MPFTFAHPAIVIPFRRYLSLTGLVIGSMSPDFEYFIKMKISNVHGHSLAGMFYYDLPISLIIALLFHNVIRDCLIANLPKSISGRLNQFLAFNWNEYFNNSYLKVTVSVLIGIFSHLFWDAFTHETGYFVESNEWLKSSIAFAAMNFPVYKVLQHLSTVVGGIFLSYCFLTLPKIAVNQRNDLKYWYSVFSISVVIMLIKMIYESFQIQIGNLIVTIIASIFLGILLSSVWFKRNYY